jgi:hypothetical protein
MPDRDGDAPEGRVGRDRVLTPGERRRTARLLELAQAEFGALSEPDRWLIRCAALGERADFSQDDDGVYLRELRRRRDLQREADAHDDDVRAGRTPVGERSTVEPWPTPPVQIDPRVVRWLLTDAQALTLVDAHGIDVSCVEIVGLLDMRNASLQRDLGVFRSLLRTGADLLGVKGRALNFGGSQLIGRRVDGGTPCALLADGATFSGGVFLRSGFRAEGEVRMIGASVGGTLDCSGGSFRNPNSHAISADGAQFAGNVDLRTHFRAEGEVRLLGASVGGDLICLRGSFVNPGSIAVSADRAQISGGVFMNNGFRAESEVRLLGASVGGNLACSGGSFVNTDGDAIVLDGAEIAGGVLMNNGFCAEGEVRLIGASVGVNLECSGGSFVNAAGDAITLDGAEVKGTLLLRGLVRCEGVLDLTRSRIAYLNDEPGTDADRPVWPEKIMLADCRYDALHGGSPLDARSRLDWLDNHDRTMREYLPDGHPPDPQPYRQLAEVLKRQGYDDDARTVLRVCAARRMQPLRKRAFREGPARPRIYLLWIVGFVLVMILLQYLIGREGLVQRWFVCLCISTVLYLLLGLAPGAQRVFVNSIEWARVFMTQFSYWGIVGHGYARWRAALCAFVIFALGTIVFNVKSDVNMQPAQAVAMRAWTIRAASDMTPAQDADTEWVLRYPKFDPVVYSLDTLLPLVSFHQEDHWTPSGRGRLWGISWWGWFVKNVYLPLHIAAGWVIATLFVASFTRLMRSEG